MALPFCFREIYIRYYEEHKEVWHEVCTNYPEDNLCNDYFRSNHVSDSQHIQTVERKERLMPLLFVRDKNLLLYETVLKNSKWRYSMMDMLDLKCKEFREASESMRNCLCVEASKGIETMDAENLVAIQTAIKFMNAATDLIVEQAETISCMNKKLNRLLERREK